jgi:hypothetical protein
MRVLNDDGGYTRLIYNMFDQKTTLAVGTNKKKGLYPWWPNSSEASVISAI